MFVVGIRGIDAAAVVAVGSVVVAWTHNMHVVGVGARFKRVPARMTVHYGDALSSTTSPPMPLACLNYYEHHNAQRTTPAHQQQ